jgi:hemerythrin-like domain-containing protein
MNALLIFFHYFGDVLHQAKEESILFPALKSSKEFASSAQLAGLLEEHNEERGLLEKTQFLLFTDEENEFITSARKVVDLLSQHMDKEEKVLFLLADRILAVAKADEITLKLEEADAVFGFRQRQLLMDMLCHLEDKYIRKVA